MPNVIKAEVQALITAAMNGKVIQKRYKPTTEGDGDTPPWIDLHNETAELIRSLADWNDEPRAVNEYRIKPEGQIWFLPVTKLHTGELDLYTYRRTLAEAQVDANTRQVVHRDGEHLYFLRIEFDPETHRVRSCETLPSE